MIRFSLVCLAALMVISAGCESKPTGVSTTGGSATGGSATGGSTPETAKPTATKRIVLLNNTDSPFWDAARAGIQQAADDLKLAKAGFTASMDSNDGTEQGQIEKLRQYGTQRDIAAVIISPISSSNPAIADELEKLSKKGVIIGCFDDFFRIKSDG